MKEVNDNASVLDVSSAEIAPPFSDLQFSKVRVFKERGAKFPGRLSAAPFPDDRVMEENVLPLMVSEAPEAEL